MSTQSKHFLISLLGAAAAFLIVFFNLLYPFDRILKDKFYQEAAAPSSEIAVIGIDEATIKELGNFSSWARSETARLISILTENPENAPSVIAVDIMFQGEGNGDEQLLEACKKAGNVVFAKQLLFTKDIILKEDMLTVDENAVKGFVGPFKELSDVTKQGLINAVLDSDGVMRSTMLYGEYNDEKIYSMSYTAADIYAQKHNIILKLPKTDKNGFFPIRYTAKMESYYSGNSFIKVLDGTIPPKRFKDKIVIIGAYSSGMADSYATALDPSILMPGAEIQANIIDSFLSGRHFFDVPVLMESLTAFLIVFFLLLINFKGTIKRLAFSSLSLFGLFLIFTYLLKNMGIRFSLIYIPIFISTAFICFVASYYIAEIKRRAKIIGMFKQYVSPQVVDSIIKTERNLATDNRMRDVCAMFLDIRSFTSLSENANPQQVVSMLNEYLKLITDVTFRYGGMIDKFLGDGAMVLFNAPFDLEDYEMKSVQCAMEIARLCRELSDKYERIFGREVMLGIGIHCGNAIVGNIGTEFRLDYTGIGDTINTASRLCSKAPAGRVVISKMLLDRLNNRIEAEHMGDVELKGKKEKFPCFLVNKIL